VGKTRSARQTDAVLGVDLNPRCLRFAALNAALNGLEHLTFVQGSWYAPVRDRAFDLILANLPFAIAPTVECLFEHASDPCGDGASREAVTGAAAHLTPGGTAHILCSWIVRDPEHWAEPVGWWLEDGGCDAIILRHGLEEAAAYAVARNQHLRVIDPASFGGRVSEWREAFASANIPWIAWGAVALRRRADVAANWIAAFQDVALPGRRGGDAVQSIFAGADFLEHNTRPDTLLARRLTAGTDLRCTQVRGPLRIDPSIRRYELDLPEGCGIRVNVDEITHATLTRLPTARSLLSAIPEDARERGAAKIALAFRELIASGFVKPQ